MKWIIKKLVVADEAQRRMTEISAAVHAIRQLPHDQHWQIEVKPLKTIRTHSQNDLLWGAIYPPIMEEMGLQGATEKEELHEFFCGEYFGWNEKTIFGRRKLTPKRTTTKDEDGKTNTLSKVEFAEFVDFIIRKAAENGIVITW